MGRSSWVVGVFALSLCLSASALSASAITGMVVDTDGSPVAGARVILAEVPSPLFPTDEPLVLAEQTSGAAGAFAFEDVGGQRLEVLAVHDGRIAATRIGDHATEELRLTFPGPPWFAARVTRLDGTGVPGARVMPGRRIILGGDEPMSLAIPDDVARMLAAVSDDTGRFELRGLRFREPSPEDSLRLGVEAPGCAPFTYTVGLGRTDDIVLPETGSIRGRLYTEEADLPMEGVPVHAELDMRRLTAGVDVWTDAEGVFVFDGLPFGVWKLCVDPKGDLPYAATPVRALVLPGRTAEVDLQVRPTTRVNGSVVDAASGAPMAGRTVAVLLQQWEPTEREELATLRLTDAQGRFSARLLPGYEAYLDCSDHYREGDVQIAADEWGTGQDITLPPIKVALTRARVAEVTVLGPDGGPAAGASVLLPGGGWHVTDENGKATVSDVNLEEEELWPVAVHGADASARVAEMAADGKFVVRLQAGAAGRVSGRVADQDGSPLPGAEVTLQLEGLGTIQPEGPVTVCGAGPDGTFLTDPLPAGIGLSPEVTVKGAPPVDLAECAVEAGATSDLGDITIRVAKAEVVGRVLDKAGGPVSGARVFASAQPGAPRTESGADGSFRLTGLWVADTYVFGEHPQLGFNGVRVSAGRPAEIRLGDPAAMYVPTPLEAPTLEARLAWARQALNVLAAHGCEPYSSLLVLEQVAVLDPKAAREWCAKLGVTDQDFGERTRTVRLRTEPAAALEDWRAAVPVERLAWEIAEAFYRSGLWPDGPSDEVVAAVEQLLPQADDASRPLAMCALARACTRKDLPRAMAYSEEAWRALENIDLSVDDLTRESLVEHGFAELALARPLEAVNLAMAYDTDLRYSLPSLAEAAAHTDPELARALTLMVGEDPEDDPDTLADMACSVAGDDPDRALAVLETAPRGTAETVEAYARVAEALQLAGHHEHALRAVDGAAARAYEVCSSLSQEPSESMGGLFARSAAAAHIVGHPCTGELVLRALSWRWPEQGGKRDVAVVSPAGRFAILDEPAMCLLASLAATLSPVDKAATLFLVNRSVGASEDPGDAMADVLIAAVDSDPALALQLVEAWLENGGTDAAFPVAQGVREVVRSWGRHGQ